MREHRLTYASLWLFIPSVVMISAILSGFGGCMKKETIRVGFAAQLTGVQAELGVQERNGVELALEEINAAGGISGRPVALIVRDDQGTPEGARTADGELIKAGVVAVIGHATSAQTIAGLSVTNPARIVMISPTATTPELSGLDDFFFRVSNSLEDRTHMFARHIYQHRRIPRVAVVTDTNNAAYSLAYRKSFETAYRALGGRVVGREEFSSKERPDFTPIVKKLRPGNPDGVLIIAADMDAALIAQRIRFSGWTVPLFTTSWAQTETLINDGGRAVDGMEIEVSSVVTNQNPEYAAFQSRYHARFGAWPSFGASQGYETAKVLAAALLKTGGRAENLPQALTGIRDFKGLNDAFSFNRYGDVVRSFKFAVIREGKFTDIEAVERTRFGGN